MPVDSAFLLILLFVVAAAAGWYFARLTGTGREREPRGEDFSADYFQGLNFLLNEQPDKALEVFLRMVDVDSDTLDTHFALGSLFRRRGEVYRAIRIHQNIIERPELPRADRERAMNALADDYLKAGLLDRAEEIFKQLGQRSTYKEQALRGLVGIYEQERDWERAIEVRDQLATVSPQRASATIVAHYCCELAEGALAEGNIDTARQYLRRARAADRDCTRGALLRAGLAMDDDDHRLAARLYRKILRSDGAFAPTVLAPLRDCYAAMGDDEGFQKLLDKLIEEQPALLPGIAYAAIVEGRFNDPVTASCIYEFVQQNPILTDLLDILRPGGAVAGEEADNIRRVTRALKRLAGRGPKYLCENCGFAAGALVWQCPSCRSWDTTRPMNFFKLEVTLSAPARVAEH